MTDWTAVKQDDYSMPAGAEAHVLVEELCGLLASPDPVDRDELGYSVLATWLSRDLLTLELRRGLGDEMAGRLSGPDIWTRSFAALILDALVEYGTFEPGWVPPFVRWYAAETDQRGHDPELGWLHAVAHGADLLGTLGRQPEVDPGTMLDLAARRLVAPTDFVWRDAEDERLGHAIALTLTRPELDAAASVQWVQTVEDGWASRDPGPPSPSVSNAARTLRVVLGMTLTGARPSGGVGAARLTQAEAVQTRILAALHTLAPHMW